MRRCKYRYILALILGIIIGSIIYAQPVEESHKTVYSTDSLFSVKISQHWHSGVELNNAANLQIKSKNGDLALIVITESKGDFPIGFSLEEHTQVTTQNMLARLQNGKLSTPTYLDINDNKAIQYRISGTIDDYNLVYVQSTIEGNHHFYQVLAWALKSKIVDYFDEIDDVVESLKIIDKPGQKTTPLPSLSKLMIAEDSSCQIKVPTRWTQYSNLNDNAILQLGSKDEDVFLIVIAENKEDFSGMTLPKYLEVVTGSLATGLKDTLFTKPIQEKVDGSPALQQEISGV
ncbi:hypothetical protein GWN26_09605, partial [Candidatus Saccharibacteria bacterium]|nr:hypothetical protein [Calditrichia bacterium]NIV72353.1 hypothetical protein [Calditrichia bacterium]NIV99373.1 hypothetical protein [Candidatus Saccharibacteria bacterium]NIW79663.1 hypothetical protein [Calditrichia bacterium]